jgi:uncharacterized repeat protein (TIGR03803 family)
MKFVVSAVLFGSVVAAGSAQTPTFTNLHSFAGGTDGSNSWAGLTLGTDGVLYGTTEFGGVHGGQGTVFSLTPPSVPGDPWSEAILHSFSAGADGAYPESGVSISSGGTLYGTTTDGGNGYGTIYSMTPPASAGGTWTEVVLYSFENTTDGAIPVGGVVVGQDGSLYGSTTLGGYGYGTIYQLAQPATKGGAWSFTLLHTLAETDVNNIFSNLTLGAGGVLYAVGRTGGFRGTSGGIEEFTPPTDTGGTWTTQLLHGFGENVSPTGSVVIGRSGVLYGTTNTGDASYSGTVFKLSPPASAGGSWTETTLYSFAGIPGAARPYAALLIGPAGELYGTTESGGTLNDGTVFVLYPPPEAGGSWTESVLHSFTAATDGSLVKGWLVFGRSNSGLYGSTTTGGSSGKGTVFQILL